MATSTLTGRFDQLADIDDFRVSLVAGQRYLFQLRGNGSTPAEALRLELFAPGSDTLFGRFPVLVGETFNEPGRFDVSRYPSTPYTAEISGVFQLRVQFGRQLGGATATTGGYSVSVSDIAADDHADIRTLGTRLGVGQTLSGTLDYDRELDWFRVELLQGKRYSFGVDATDSAGQHRISRLALYGIGSAGDDDPVASHFVQTGVSAPADFAYVAPASGTYYLRMQPEFNDGGGQAGIKYLMTMREVANDSVADYANPQSPLLIIGSSVNSSFDRSGDLDVYRVELSAGQRYFFRFNTGSDGTSSPYSLRVHLQLLADDGRTVLAEDVGERGVGDVRFAFTAPSSGSHYLRVASFDDKLLYYFGGYVGSYTLGANTLAADDRPDRISASTPATVLSLGTPLNSQFDVRGDIDNFSVLLLAGKRYQLSLTASGAGASQAAALTLIDPSGEVQQEAYEPELARAPLGISFVYTATVDGVHVLKAQEQHDFLQTADGGSYRLGITAVALDDHADQRSGATPMVAATPGQPTVVPGTWDKPGDTDWFRVDLDAGQRMLFTLNAGPDSLKVLAQLWLFSANGDYLAQDADRLIGSDSGARFSFQAPVAGSYYLLAERLPGNTLTAAVQAYTLRAEALARDDHGDAPLFSTLLLGAANAPPTGAVVITGTAQVLNTLVASSTLADADGLGALSYQWLRGGVNVAGATGTSYRLLPSDAGAVFSVKVSYVDGGGTAESVSSAPTAAVVTVTIDGTNDPDRLAGTAGNDWVRALGGNDVLKGEAGDDLLDGGPGLDVADYRGTTAVTANLATGVATQGGDSDKLIGIEALFGSSAADTLRGLDGAGNLGETFRGNGGNDSIDGGTGIDTAEFSGKRADYTITRTPGTMNITVAHNNGGADGTDSLNNIEHLVFADRVVAFGPRAEEVARVAFALWTPAIYGSPTLFSKGISFYDNEFNYGFDFLCQVALQYHPETGAALAAKLKSNIPASSFTAAQLLEIMNNNGGGESVSGRAAAVKAVALDAATTQQLELTGVTSQGVVASFNFDSEVYFGLLPG
jgi:RTX calcium-binding nonapeptide repeat (4 copies)